MNITQSEDGDARLAGDLLVGGSAIAVFLADLGWSENPEDIDVYYLKKSGWPIGSTAAAGGGKLAALKPRLIRHIEKITRGKSAA